MLELAMIFSKSGAGELRRHCKPFPPWPHSPSPTVPCYISRSCDMAAVLWSHSWAPIKGDPVSAVIHGILLEDRAANDEFQDANYKVKWLSLIHI